MTAAPVIAEFRYLDLPIEAIWILGGAVAIGAAWIAIRGRRRRMPAAAPAWPEINLADLGEAGPPAGGPTLELYNTPVRLAAAVLAPAGRGNAFPPNFSARSLADHLLPGLSQAAGAHGTRFVVWPPQLSTQGFATAFFARLRLPGRRGKGSPWSAVAGRFEADGASILPGLVLRARGANNLGQFVLDHENQWLDVLRVKPGASGERAVGR